MSTNINLVAPELEKKPVLSGKLTLILSACLVVAVFLIWGGLSFFSNRYLNEKSQIDSEIQSEKAKMTSADNLEMAEFQGKLALIGKVLDDHVPFDIFIKKFSQYILPDVRLSSFSMENGGESVSASGTAPNFEVLSRQLMLFKNSPAFQSVDFGSASLSQTASGETSVTFSFKVKINKEKLNK